MEQNFGKGRKGQTVRIIDFENPDNHEFLCVSQFKVEGSYQNIIPDIVLFVNGLPLVVIECKSPYITNPMEAGVKQRLRYANRRQPHEDDGAERLFWYNQMMVSTHRDKAAVGTISSRMEHYLEWKDPYPLTVDQLIVQVQPEAEDQPVCKEHLMAAEQRGTYGLVNSQQVLIAGIFNRKNFLDLIQNFTVFETVEGRTVKKLARHQQYRAVHKTIHRLKTGKTRKEQGGVIWHTQGSGKSLTMVFLAMKLRRDPDLRDYKLVFITDRTQLDRQLTNTFQRTQGETVYHAHSVANLKELLQKDSSDVVTAMMQKFQEGDDDFDFPVLNESDRIIVLADEAHRTQYGTFGVAINTGLPNARKIAFTGTPLIRSRKTNPTKQKQAIENFKRPISEAPLSFIVVKDKLLTGFDAPVCQVMYLDQKLREHTLLQAIARVNRTYPGKFRSFVVDYYGLSDYLTDALEMFSTEDVACALKDLKDEIPKLKAAHTCVMRHFKDVDKNDIDACVLVLEDDDVRRQFEIDFKLSAKQMDIIMPDPAAQPYLADLKFLGKVNLGAKNLYRDTQLDLAGVGEKVRMLIDEHIRATGVDPKIPPVDLLAADFKKKVNAHKSDRAKASEIEHAIKHHIDVNLDREKLLLQQVHQTPKPKEYVSGECFTYLGRNYRLKVESGPGKSVKLKSGRLVVQVPSSVQKRDQYMQAALTEWYRTHALEKLQEKVARYSKVVRVSPSSVGIKTFSGRWGSCSTTGKMEFNWRIIMAPNRIVDYVVVHELCHLHHHNHSPEFWKCVERVFPDYAASKEWLKVNGRWLDV